MTSNSGYICEDSTEAALWTGWDTLREYLHKIEEYLQQTTEQFDTRVSDNKKTLTPGLFKEFEKDHVEEYIFYYDEFPYILRNSFFVSVYSLLDFDRGRIRRMFRDAKQKPPNLSGLIDRGICKEINKYSKLRNCIVHSNGFPKGSDRDYKPLIRYIREKGLGKERFMQSNEEVELEIGLTKEFCKEAVDTMQKFIDAFYKDSIRRLGK
jgi:hypothetical protein